MTIVTNKSKGQLKNWAALFVILLGLNQLYAAALTQVSVAVNNNRAGETTTHTVAFIAPSAIPADGIIRIGYPAGFQVSSATLNTTNINGGFSVSYSGQWVIITRDGTGTATTPGGSFTVSLNSIQNASFAGSYTVSVETQDNLGFTIDNGTSSSFDIAHNVLSTMSVSAPASATAGVSFTLTVSSAQDVYGNSWTGTVTVSVYSGGGNSPGGTSPTLNSVTVTNGSGSAQQTLTNAQATVLQGTGDSFSEETASIQVAVGSVVSMTLSCGSAQTAGTTFSLTASNVTDALGNGWTGSVTVSVFSGGGNSPGGYSPTLNSIAVVSGTGSADQTLTNAVATVLQGTADGLTQQSPSISVSTSDLNDFSVSCGTQQSAGNPFSLSVSSAADVYGNGWDGTVAVSIFSGGGDSPQGTSPTLSDVTVTDGSGSADQTLTNTVTTVLRGSANGINRDTSPITVSSSALNGFSISGLPASATAGQAFSGTVIVTALDEWGNPKDDYSGPVTWSSTDGAPHAAGFPTDDGSGWSGGQKSFAAGSFVLYNGPSQTFTVSGSGFSETSDAITVNPGPLDVLTMSGAPGTTYAGQQFTLDITVTAYDEYGNLKTDYAGAVAWSSTDGAPYPAALPLDNGSGWSNGSKSFDGSSFILYNGDTQTLTVSDGSVSATSASIQVYPSELNRFSLAGVPSSVQAGIAFSNGITVTAWDGYGNQKTNYTGTVTWTSSDGSASLPADSPSGWTNGQKYFVGSGFTLRTSPSQTLTVTDGSVSYTTGSIFITFGTLNAFDLNCNASQVAGVPFALSVTNAQDAFGNDWSGTLSVTPSVLGGDSPNGMSPTFNNILVSGGTGQSNQTLVNAETGVALQGRVGSVMRTVSNITVTPGSLYEMKIRDSAGGGGTEVTTHTMIVGDTYTLYAAGYDVYGNYRGEEISNWTSQGLTPPVSEFSTSTLDFEPTAQGNGTITATHAASGVSDYTGTITVNPGAVSRFGISVINTQVVGQPFSVTITAYDALDNIVSNFTGRVTISDSSGSVQPQVSGTFINGSWTGGLTISQARTTNRIIVEEEGAGANPPSGLSNEFNVIAYPGIRILSFDAVGHDSSTVIETVTQNQARVWHLKMVVENLSGNAMRLEGGQHFRFIVGGIERGSYTVALPDTFMGSRTNEIAGESVDSLLAAVTVTGPEVGTAAIQGFLGLVHTITGDELEDQALLSMTMQTEADLVISNVLPSQPEVTMDQDSVWTVDMVLFNDGQSDVLIDSVSVDTALTFSIGDSWVVERPDSLAGGGWLLAGNARDTLHFTIQHTTGDAEGPCALNGRLIAEELNSGRLLIENTLDGGSGSVDVVSDVLLRIASVENIAPNAPFVNIGQNFNLKVEVENAGGDAVTNATLHLVTLAGGNSSFTLDTPLNEIGPGEIREVEISGTAGFQPSDEEIFQASVEGWAENTKAYRFSDPVTNPDDTARVVIQTPASLTVNKVILLPNEVLGGQKDSWTVQAVVSNGGQAGFILQPENATLEFRVGTLQQTDYDFTLPTAFLGGDTLLPGGDSDTLAFTVIETGLYGGEVDVNVGVAGVDENSETAVEATGTEVLSVLSNPSFRIISTHLRTPHLTENRNGLVNTGQDFTVVVVVENGLDNTLSNIVIDLEGVASSIAEDRKTIDTLTPAQWDSVEFRVTAAAVANTGGETLKSTLVEGSLPSGLLAPMGPSLDSVAVAVIQTPATLTLSANQENDGGLYSVNQTFEVTARLSNSGQGLVDTTGRVEIVLPSPYVLEPGEDAVQFIGTQRTVSWQVRTPVNAHADPRTVDVRLVQPPLQLNTDTEATVAVSSQVLMVQSGQSALYLSTEIYSPAGAVDGELSTRQTFVVEATLTGDYIGSKSATLLLPTGYSTVDDLTKVVVGDKTSWLITAPTVPSDWSNIQITSQGESSLNTGETVSSVPSVLQVKTVRRAEMVLSLSTIDNSVSLGQVFEVTATVDNRGEASAVGEMEVRLDPLPTGYTTTNSLRQTVVGGQASWMITAPKYPTHEAVNIRAWLSKLPFDENTSDTTFVSERSGSVAITTVGTWLSVAPFARPDSVGGLVVPGDEWVWMMALQLVNRGEEGANGIAIESIDFALRDFEGLDLPPSDVLERLRIVKMIHRPDTTYFQRFYDFADITADEMPAANPLEVPFTRREFIESGDTLYIAIFADMQTGTGLTNFQLVIPGGDDIHAVDEYSSEFDIPVLDVSESEIINLASWQKQVLDGALLGENAEPYLLNYPNPFGRSGREKTTIVYYLKESTSVKFRLFTLTGKLVWTRDYSASDPQGQQGLHSKGTSGVFWDGRNDMGYEVLNGVYILIMETGYGESARVKVALVK